MARFSGVVGYGESAEGADGVWRDVITEFPYRGDVLRNTRALESDAKVNDDIVVGNSISIVADQFANDHFFNIRYVMWMGKRWIVNNVEVRAPRLILSLGKIYNGPLPDPTP